MRRPIIPGLKERDQETNLVTRPITSKLELAERLRRKRTKEYLELLADLDMHSEVSMNVDSVIISIEKHFMDVPKKEQLIGILAKCYLDDCYDVHLIDRDKTILQHIKKSDSLPKEFAKARRLALHPSYACIEVYPDCLRAIAINGEVSVVKE
ncbi:hypothetical protein MK805_14815 [Shimazuella sp. AN120528]|uniref:hypothetical protein n=1 Tax=Shimazuella soli TaxID=1892854 RepID=UPI001F0D2FF3|nr:hypothetical protein [Shimazuella soli]MCH5586212.1 hypothetical protein [Shimazuella soli]